LRLGYAPGCADGERTNTRDGLHSPAGATAAAKVNSHVWSRTTSSAFKTRVANVTLEAGASNDDVGGSSSDHSSGCGCRMAPNTPHAPTALLLGVLALIRRRRSACVPQRKVR
jgi:MYXO-CTERM domain-containing protein